MIVLPENLEVPSTRLEAADRVLHLECEYLNLGSYDQWLALFSEDCLYWAPLAPGQNDAKSHSSLFHENRELMRMRIDRITHEAAHSLAGGIRTSRTVGTAALREIEEESGDWIVERRFQMTERQGERTRLFAGLCTYRLTPGRESFLIREKRVDLIDCDQPHEPLEVFF